MKNVIFNSILLILILIGTNWNSIGDFSNSNEPDYIEESKIDEIFKISDLEKAGYTVKVDKQTLYLSRNNTPEVLAICNITDPYDNLSSILVVNQYDEKTKKWNNIYNNTFDLETLSFEGKLSSSETESAVISCAFSGHGTTISAMILNFENNEIKSFYISPQNIIRGTFELDEENNIFIFKDIDGSKEEIYSWDGQNFKSLTP